ncbi:MAG: hypothetical protein H6565_06880 [Lewinellaceae bacterium]|nr:hypothetical protein [Lewinellaceae bacterium]MCB9353763.1 hypothetical protein [Lewinellaceae bacterium]
MKITEIAYKLNDRSSKYKIGRLQEIRKQIKGFKKKAGDSIFHDDSISEKGWAFHYGGRKELQFNIGLEDEGLRFGLAFSLEPSQSLPDISILFPKIYKLNCLIREEPERFSSYLMWHWQRGRRSEMTEVREIKPELINNQTFVFFGRIVAKLKIDFDEILTTFDNLLDIYLEIENEINDVESKIKKEIASFDFEFLKRERRLIVNREYSSIEKVINVDIRHTLLQQKLIEELMLEYGAENISVENPLNGKKIDVVVKEKDGYIFFEIKTGSSAKACIREAIGQLLEYAYWGGKEHAKKLVIASEYELNIEGSKYLELLKNRFNIPIQYRRIIIER